MLITFSLLSLILLCIYSSIYLLLSPHYFQVTSTPSTVLESTAVAAFSCLMSVVLLATLSLLIPTSRSSSTTQVVRTSGWSVQEQSLLLSHMNHVLWKNGIQTFADSVGQDQTLYLCSLFWALHYPLIWQWDTCYITAGRVTLRSVCTDAKAGLEEQWCIYLKALLMVV